MRKILLIDGILDISPIYAIEIMNHLSNTLLIIGWELQKQGYNVEYKDFRLHSKINVDAYTYIICKADINNLLIIEQLKINKSKLFLHTLNNELKVLFPLKNVFYKGILNIDENDELGKNINQILNHFDIKESYQFVYDYNYWKLLDNLKDIQAINLYIGTGCNKQCSFCNISSSKIHLNKPETIISELKFLISQGIKYFHVKNHITYYHIQLFFQIEQNLKELYLEHQFTWSCNFVVDDLNKKVQDMLTCFSNYGLKRILINVEHWDDNILMYYQLKNNKEAIKNFIKKAFNTGIYSVVINYVIGSPKETKETLDILKQTSLELLNYAPGIIEFNINFYYSEKIDIFIDKNSLLMGYPRINPIHEVNIPINELIKFKMDFFHSVYSEMAKHINLKNALNHIELSLVNVATQYYIYTISKTSAISIHNFIKNEWQLLSDIDIKNLLVYRVIILGYIYHEDNTSFLIWIRGYCMDTIP
jgi:hypothetical protein